MNNNIIDHLQPATMQSIQRKFYPTSDNTIENPMGISDEAVEVMRAKPIGQRKVQCFLKCAANSPEQTRKEVELLDLLNAYIPEVEALRKEPSWIEKKRREDELPIVTLCCVLDYSNEFIGERHDYRVEQYKEIEYLKKNVSLVQSQSFNIRHYDTIKAEPTFYPINYTCLIDFDILQDDNPTTNLDELKSELREVPIIAYCGRATNGIDLYCIVPISTPQRYSEHAWALIHQFRRQGIIIRVADSITHTRTLSSDPSGHFNGNAVEFTKFG